MMTVRANGIRITVEAQGEKIVTDAIHVCGDQSQEYPIVGGGDTWGLFIISKARPYIFTLSVKFCPFCGLKLSDLGVSRSLELSDVCPQHG